MVHYLHIDLFLIAHEIHTYILYIVMYYMYFETIMFSGVALVFINNNVTIQ